MSATESTAYVVKQGGDVIIEELYRVGMRALLDNRTRGQLREHMRRKVIDRLAEASGLPFAVAITAIERWEETEHDWQPSQHYRLPRAEQPVVLVTKCRVRRVQYPEVPV